MASIQTNKKATTSQQFELLIAEMNNNVGLARGMPTFGSNRSSLVNSWQLIADKLNAIGPPVRSGPEWRKVWTDLRCRTKKKSATNNASIKQTGGGPYSEWELSPIEQAVEGIMCSSRASKPVGNVFGVNKTPSKYKTLNISHNNEEPAETAIDPYTEFGMTRILNTPNEMSESSQSSVEMIVTDLPQSTSKKTKVNKKDESEEVSKLMANQTKAIEKNAEVLVELLDLVKSQNEIAAKHITCLEEITKVLRSLTPEYITENL